MDLFSQTRYKKGEKAGEPIDHKDEHYKMWDWIASKYKSRTKQTINELKNYYIKFISNSEKPQKTNCFACEYFENIGCEECPIGYLCEDKFHYLDLYWTPRLEKVKIAKEIRDAWK